MEFPIPTEGMGYVSSFRFLFASSLLLFLTNKLKLTLWYASVSSGKQTK